MFYGIFIVSKFVDNLQFKYKEGTVMKIKELVSLISLGDLDNVFGNIYPNVTVAKERYIKACNGEDFGKINRASLHKTFAYNTR